MPFAAVATTASLDPCSTANPLVLLNVTPNVNGLAEGGTLTAADIAARVGDLGDDAWLDLGGGHGAIFLGQSAEDLASLLETRTMFF